MTKSKLYIIPVTISDNTLTKVIPDYNKSVVSEIRIFVVEKLKTARQFLRKQNPDFPIDDCVFFELDKHNEYNFEKDLVEFFKKGEVIGLMSESGYPGVADPGTNVVKLAHKFDATIIPLIGPNSILIALACSGLNGQGFTFHGYLPKKSDDLTKKLKEMQQHIDKTQFAQVFIETPFRNKNFFDELLKNVNDEKKLMVGYDLTGESEFIKTKNISDWKKSPFQFDKLPCVFILGV